MRLSSMFFALFLAPLALPAQTSSMTYSSPRPTQGCPVSVAAQRVAGNALVQTDTPVPAEEEKQMRARILILKGQIDVLKTQEAALRARFTQNPDAASSADFQHQLNAIDAQLAERQIEANQLSAKLAPEQAKRNTNGVYTPASGLDLHIAAAESRPIAAVDILVHGFSNRGQLMPASQIPNAVVDSPSHVSVGPSDLDRNRSGSGPTGIEPTQSFHLTRDGAGGSIHTSITTRMTGISWLEVTHVEFVDGSTWQPTSGETCRFAPSLYVPVSSAQ
jgi:hypothetical protein